MKKISVVILTMLICLTSQAQIQRNFWGLELGLSTKNDVKRFLNIKGLKYSQNLGGFDTIEVESGLGNDGLSFGGYSWDTSFLFHHDILFSVLFMKLNTALDMSTGEFYEIDTKFMFHQLRGKLSNKYYNLENPHSIDDPYKFERRDSRTEVSLQLDNGTLVINYIDQKLSQAIKEGDDL